MTSQDLRGLARDEYRTNNHPEDRTFFVDGYCEARSGDGACPPFEPAYVKAYWAGYRVGLHHENT